MIRHGLIIDTNPNDTTQSLQIIFPHLYRYHRLILLLPIPRQTSPEFINNHQLDLYKIYLITYRHQFLNNLPFILVLCILLVKYSNYLLV